MSKFRLIKERTLHKETEQNLRGLGTSSILKNDQPQPYLAIHDLDQSKTEPLLDKYGCQVSANQSGITFVTSKVTKENFKIESLQLFCLSIVLVETKVTSKIEMAENDWLRIELGNAVLNTNEKYEAFNYTHFDESGILLSSLQSHTLHQAGFNISMQDRSHLLNLETIRQISQSLKESSTGVNVGKKSRLA